VKLFILASAVHNITIGTLVLMMDCCIWYSEERPGLTSIVITTATALKTRGQSVECIPPQRHSEVDTVSLGLPSSCRCANPNLIKLISCSLVHYLPIHSQIAWKSAYNFWIYSANKQTKRHHGCEHYPASLCRRLRLTRNVGQCPAWWPPCRI